jgi:hypothetical protein
MGYKGVCLSYDFVEGENRNSAYFIYHTFPTASISSRGAEVTTLSPAQLKAFLDEQEASLPQ